MSSFVNFVLRQRGVLHKAVISSGGLSCVFDPALFQSGPTLARRLLTEKAAVVFTVDFLSAKSKWQKITL